MRQATIVKCILEVRLHTTTYISCKVLSMCSVYYTIHGREDIYEKHNFKVACHYDKPWQKNPTHFHIQFLGLQHLSAVLS